jgi:hypothetical protein
VQYSEHALRHLTDRFFTKTEVEAVIANPTRGIYEPKARDRREHFGYAADGRLLNVVTNKAVTVVISVIEQ